MIHLTLCLFIFGPQAFAGWRGFSPAAHLTLLLLSLTVASSALLSLTAGAPDPLPTSQNALPAIGYATVGLAMLAPLYWAIEPLLPSKTTAIAAVLVQSLALCFAAAIWGKLHNLAQPLTEWFAVGLVAGLFAIALSVLWHSYLRK